MGGNISIGPRVVIAIPSRHHRSRKNAPCSIAQNVPGRGACSWLREPMAAAIGAGLPVTEPTCEHDRGHRRRDRLKVAIIFAGGYFRLPVGARGWG